MHGREDATLPSTASQLPGMLSFRVYIGRLAGLPEMCSRARRTLCCPPKAMPWLFVR